jgi:hypothetical protein
VCVYIYIYIYIYVYISIYIKREQGFLNLPPNPICEISKKVRVFERFEEKNKKLRRDNDDDEYGSAGGGGESVDKDGGQAVREGSGDGAGGLSGPVDEDRRVRAGEVTEGGQGTLRGSGTRRARDRFGPGGAAELHR